MILAEPPVADRLLHSLVECLRGEGLHATADRLTDAHPASRVALTPDDRDAILLALERCPYGLADLHSVLRLEHRIAATP